MMIRRHLLSCMTIVLASWGVCPQSLQTSVSVQATHGSRFRSTLGIFHRSEDHLRGTARWSANIQEEYRPMSALSLFAGYTFLYNHAYAGDNTRYWQPRHRLFASVMPRYSRYGFNFNFRQMYQIVLWHDHGGNRVQRLRSRIYVERPVYHDALRPFTYYELLFDPCEHLSMKTHQLTAGLSYYPSASNKVTLQYRHIFRTDGRHPTDGLDILGVSYMYLFKGG